MKYTLIALFGLLLCTPTFSQTDSDTTIYAVAESMPMAMLASCAPSQHPGWTMDSTRRCSEQQLMLLLAQNIRYPQAAREKNVQGVVAISFVVEKNGRTTGHKILKDIGEGCGEESLRVMRALDEAGLRWLPGTQGGKPVRTTVTVPLKFRLEDAKPFIVNDFGDSIYVDLDVPASFPGGLDSLAKYVVNNIEYPKSQLDSCKTGVVEMSLVIYPDASVRVDNQLDFNNLGGDFQFNAIRFANRTAGKWAPAQFEGKAVASNFTLRLPFKSSAKGCATANDKFEKSMLLADEAVTLADTGKADEALAKISEALVLHPRNTEFLYYRANIYLGANKKEEACADFTQIKSILGYTWFESFGRVLCGW